MFHSLVLDLNVILMPNLLPILLNFSDIPGYYCSHYCDSFGFLLLLVFDPRLFSC
jgi:hypothetical protein